MKILPHICFVAPAVYPIFDGPQYIQTVGGAEVQQSIIARGLTKAGYRVSMICLDYGQPDDIEIDGICFLKAHRIGAGIPVFRFLHPRMSSYWRAMRRVNADIYYQRSAAALTGLVALFCKRYKRRMVYAVAHDGDVLPGQRMIQYKRDKIIFKWGLKHADSIVVQTAKQREKLFEHYQKQSICIPNGYKISHVRKKAIKTDVIWVGTIKPLKQPELLIELASSLPEYSFKMVGGSITGDLQDQYFQKIKRLTAKIPNIEFTGFVPYPEVGEHFDGARLFVNTTEMEGFPNTFLEAWSRSIPTLSFFDPNVKSLSGQNVGIVADSIEHMAELIKMLLSDKMKLQQTGENCKTYVETEHLIDKIIPEYLNLFDNLLKASAK